MQEDVLVIILVIKPILFFFKILGFSLSEVTPVNLAVNKWKIIMWYVLTLGAK